MKILIIIGLYLIGLMIDVIWTFGDKEFNESFNKALNDPDFDILPEKVTKFLLTAFVIISCLAWPGDLIIFPLTQIKKT